MRTPRSSVLPLLATSLFGFGSAAAAADAPAKVEAKNATHAGTGCPAEQKAATTLSADRTSLVFELPPYDATAGVGGRTFTRANCDFDVTLAFPAGWQVSPEAFEFEAGAKVPAGGEGMVTLNFHFQGEKETESETLLFVAGTAAPKKESLKLKESWSKCGDNATLVQGLAIKVRAQGDESHVQITKAGTLRLKWRACK